MRSVRCRLVPVVLVVLLVVVRAGSVTAACWPPPVDAPVSDPFREPACRWCPGNRGLEFATRPGQPVTAVDTGRVTFAGAVAGVIHVVVQHRDGRLVTYGRLGQRRHDEGDLVLRGQIVGVAADGFHFGLREGGRYLDPAPHLGRWTGRPRLVPIDGSAAAEAPAPVLRCTDGPPARRGARGGVFAATVR